MRSVPAGTVQFQSTMRVSSSRAPAEREADATARKVMRMAAPEVATASVEGHDGPGDAPLHRKLESPYIARFADSIRLMRQRAATPLIARRGEGQPTVGANLAADIARSQGAGVPLPTGIRKFMEPRFGADFSNVRVHTGEKSARLNRQVSAQAFTVGNQIFFSRNQFRPDTPAGQELIAHELTHTLQQGSAVQHGAPLQRREVVAVTEQSSPHVQRLEINDALGYIEDAATALPGFRMLTLVLGVNPLNMNRVERSPANILRAIVEFLPGGVLITQALDSQGVFNRVGGWIEQQLGTLGLSAGTLRDSLNRFLDSLRLSDVFNPGSVWARAQRIFTDPIDRIVRFARSLFGPVMGFIKDAILRPIAELASRTRGWNLLCAVLGVNPITGEPVSRSAESLIGGFMKLIGQEEIWENIKRGNAISRAWVWFQGALSGVMSFVRQIPQRFVQAVLSLGIEDLVLLPRAFARVASVFGDFIGNFLSWAGNTAWELLEILFSVVAPNLMVYLRRAAGALRIILQNPVGFVGYLVRAAELGFRQFASRFLTHLRGSLIGWLTGALSGANIYIPQAFTLPEIIKFVLSVLGLTWQNLRQKIVRVIGEPAMRALETGFDLVMTLVTQGPAAAWEQIQKSLSNLRERVMEQIMTFVQDRVVTAAITRLLSMLSPAGAFIQAIIATYNTVMFFVERLRQISQVAASFIDSLADIAAGNIASAANRVEQTMGGMLTLVISFLARIAGLGQVSDAVTSVVNRMREPIDQALDRVVEWIVAQARRLGRMVASGAQRVVEWWRARKAFTNRGGESHVLIFQESGDSAQMLIASDEKTVEQYLAEYPDKTSSVYQTALSVFKETNQIIFSFAARNATEAARRRALIDAGLARISHAFAQLAGAPPEPSEYPQSTRLQYSGPPATKNSVECLVGEPTVGRGTPRSENSKTPGWHRVLGAGMTKKSDAWVQMHVISAAMGGLGEPNNLISAPGSINLGYFRSFEHATIKLAKASTKGVKNVVWVDFAVTWPDKEFASKIEGRAGLYVWKGKTSTRRWHKMESPSLTASAPLPRPDFREQNKISLNFSSRSTLKSIIKDSVLVELLLQNRPYPTRDDFRSKLEAACVRRGIAKYDSKIAAILGNPDVILDDVPG